jgi:toxin ParE1/3/4
VTIEVRTAERADRDIDGILRATMRLFGRNQVSRYAAIIDRGIQMVAEEPLRASSHARPELGPGVRSFHLQLAARRSRGAAHVLYYRRSPRDSRELVILRVLADAMEARRRVARSLRDEHRS